MTLPELYYRRLGTPGKAVVELVGPSRFDFGAVGQGLDPASGASPLVQRGVRLAATIPRLSLFAKQERRAQCLSVFGEIRTVAADAGMDPAACAFLPLGPWRPERSCVLLLDPAGRAVAFAKHRTGQDHAREHQSEVEYVGASEGCFASFKSPGLLAEATTTDGSVLITTTPAETRSEAAWGIVFDRLVGEVTPRTQSRIADAPWWNRGELEKRLSEATVESIVAISGNLLGTGPIHGDIRPSNVAYVANDYWLYDWETYDPNAPWAVDVLMAGVTGPSPLLKPCRADDPKCTVSLDDSVAALAYLALHGQPKVAAQLQELLDGGPHGGLKRK